MNRFVCVKVESGKESATSLRLTTLEAPPFLDLPPALRCLYEAFARYVSFLFICCLSLLDKLILRPILW